MRNSLYNFEACGNLCGGIGFFTRLTANFDEEEDGVWRSKEAVVLEGGRRKASCGGSSEDRPIMV